MDTLSLTYKELAEKMGVKVDSARKTVLRKRWQRITGNDGVVRILVPIDALPQPSDSPSDGPTDSPDDRPTVRELQAKVEALSELLAVERKRASAAELDRDRWHELAVRPWWRRLAS